MIDDSLIIGYGVVALTAIVGLFTALYKPLNENTKQPLVDDCELYDLLHSAGIKTIHEISRCRDFEEYKKHVSKSQQKQWDEINMHGKEIIELKHDFEMCRQENGKENKHNV